MSEQSELPEMPIFEEIPTIRNFDIWVRIKKTSKYYAQGLAGTHDPTISNEDLKKAKQQFFKLDHFTPTRLGFNLSTDAYCLHFNNNAYRIEDCDIFLRDPANPKNFVRIR